MADVGNWVVESSASVGQGDVILGGPVVSFVKFSDALPPGRVWYTIQDGVDRESGTGAFDGIATLVRDDVRVTVVGGVYDDDDPDPLDLSGASVVSCTFNASAFVDFETAPNLTLGQVIASSLTANTLTVNGPATINGDLTVSQIGATALFNIENTGDGNFSALTFTRERLSGAGEVGGAIWLASNTVSNDAILYITANSSTGAC